MNKLFLATVFTATSFSLVAQSRELLNESFDNNFRKWSLPDQESYSRSIANGKMKLVSRHDNYHWAGVGVPVNKKKDMKIEMELTFTKFKKGDAGIMWGCSDDYKKMYAFTVSPDGTYNFAQWAPKFQSFTGSMRSDAIKKDIGATNKLTVIKEGRKLKLLVNDVEVHTGSFPSMYGNEMGVVAGGGSFVSEIDSFVITELDKD